MLAWANLDFVVLLVCLRADRKRAIPAARDRVRVGVDRQKATAAATVRARLRGRG